MQEKQRIAESVLIQKTRRRLRWIDVAGILGISRQSLNQRMNGQISWKHEELHKLADAWGITVQQLETGFGDNHTGDIAET